MLSRNGNTGPIKDIDDFVLNAFRNEFGDNPLSAVMQDLWMEYSAYETIESKYINKFNIQQAYLHLNIYRERISQYGSKFHYLVVDSILKDLLKIYEALGI